MVDIAKAVDEEIQKKKLAYVVMVLTKLRHDIADHERAINRDQKHLQERLDKYNKVVAMELEQAYDYCYDEWGSYDCKVQRI